MRLNVPADATVLEGTNPPPLPHPNQAVRDALDSPIGSAPFRKLVLDASPQTVAITISDITRPVPNRDFLPAIIDTLNECGVEDASIVIIVGTGMHRPSTPEEHETLVGAGILSRIEVIDHSATQADTLVRISDDPPVRICKRFAQADFRIVTGYIEPHFMAGFSGGRKGVCPALVDLETVQRFHGFATLSHPRADTGNLQDNPCHQIGLAVATAAKVDFLFNVAITRDRQIAGIYCGDLQEAHLAGCQQVADWTSATIPSEIDAFDLVITNGGGYPLDQTFYQTVKGMCTALPALSEGTTLLQVSGCAEQVGSDEYTALMLSYDNNWRKFLQDIEAAAGKTHLDQWQYQLQSRVLERIGVEHLLLASDGIDIDVQRQLSVTPVTGRGEAQERTQRTIDHFLAAQANAKVAVIPEGPYTMLRRLK